MIRLLLGGRGLAPLCLLLALAPAVPLAAQGEALPESVVAAVEAAWNAKDRAGYLGAWRFSETGAREAEADFAEARLAATTSLLTLQRTSLPAPGGGRRVSAQIFTSTEPRAKVEQFLFDFEPRDGGWAIVKRASVGQVDGLVHLSLDPTPYRADGLTLRLPDLTLEMTRGSLFLSPQVVGPTAMVFVGEGMVRIRPRPPGERAQLAQYSGQEELAERVRGFFIRLHPADLHRTLWPVRLDPHPAGARDLGQAQRLYRDHSERSYLLDAPLPGSPWWLLPSLGDAILTLESSRGALTFSVGHGEPEGLSLFDRGRRRQVLLYPIEGKDTRYDEDEGRAIDVLRHDLSVRFAPATAYLEGENTMRLRIMSPSSTVRLRLHESLKVASIRSAEGGDHLFFRVRHQDSVMVSLGPLSGRTGDVSLTVRFSGVHRPDEVDREVLQAREDPNTVGRVETDVVIDSVLTYSNRTAWYPQGDPDDHALARLRFEVPPGHLAITGGTRTALRDEPHRRVLEFEQDVPGKYITAVVGRLFEVSRTTQAGIPVVAYSVGRARATVADTVAATGRILTFLTAEFGPMPYPSLNLVVIEARTPGGHSPPGMILLSQRPPLLRGSLRDDPASFHDLPGFFLAHELAHQWWGHGVAGQNYRERWIAEAFAQYAAALWIRQSMGEETFQTVLTRMGRWALRYAAEGPLHLGHRLGHLKGDPQIFRAVVYDKGAYVLHMLRGTVGEEAFRQALTRLQKDNRLGKVGSEDVRLALETASGKTLGAFFEYWVYGIDIPTLTVSQRVEGSGTSFRTVIDVAVKDLPGALPLQLSLPHGKKRDVRTVEIAPGGGRFVIETKGRPGRVELNGDRALLVRVVRK